MSRGSNYCGTCQKFERRGHRCRVRPAPPPPGAGIPVSPNIVPNNLVNVVEKETPRLGTGEMLSDEYRTLLTEVDTPSTNVHARLETLINLERSAEEHATTEEGYEEVLADANRYLVEGNVERAAILSQAAEKGHAEIFETNFSQHVQQDDPNSNNLNQTNNVSQPGHVDTFPDRVRETFAAANNMSEWETYYQNLHVRHEGTYQKGTCNPCRHTSHQGATCFCGCTQFIAATLGQAEAYDAYLAYHRARDHWIVQISRAKKLVVGDQFRVIGGGSAPVGIAGSIVRLNYDDDPAYPRICLQTSDGSTVWVTTFPGHVTRNSPGIKPKLGDPV